MRTAVIWQLNKKTAQKKVKTLTKISVKNLNLNKR